MNSRAKTETDTQESSSKVNKKMILKGQKRNIEKRWGNDINLLFQYTFKYHPYMLLSHPLIYRESISSWGSFSLKTGSL